MTPFWETKKLDEMSHEEWEAVCDGCAKCCYQTFLLEGVNTGDVQIPCQYLDEKKRHCSIYPHRQKRVRECITLSPAQPERFAWMPETCAYRLLHEGKPLPEDHPLVLGTSPFLQAEKDSAKTGVRPEESADSDDDGGRGVQQDAMPADMNVEIRTALNSIMGVAQLLASTQLTEEQKSHVETILLSSAGLLKQIDPSFDLPQSGSGLLDARDVPAELRAICDQLDKRYHPLAAGKGIDFRCECRSGVPFVVVGNAVWLEQVLSNLVQTAVRSNRNGSVALTIDALGNRPEGVELCFKVVNVSSGIDEREFKRNLETTDETGLELIVCRKLIGLMGGSLEIESAPGGAVSFQFKLTLPLSNYAPTLGKKKQDAKIDKVARLGIRVLLVEDNKVNQKVTDSMLRKAGCHVDVACDGKDAVRQFRQRGHDIVLMDCDMPVVDGYEATYRIRSMDAPLCKVPIIAVTAHARKSDRKKCFECGMNDYITKPISSGKLIDIINKYTAGQEGEPLGG